MIEFNLHFTQPLCGEWTSCEARVEPVGRLSYSCPGRDNCGWNHDIVAERVINCQEAKISITI